MGLFALFILLLLFVLLLLFWAVPLIIIFWLLVNKAGRPGWSQIIPFWSYYVLGVVAKNKRVGIIVIVLSAVSILLNMTGPKELANTVSFVQLGSVLGLWIVFARQFTSGAGKWLVFLLVPIVGVFLTGKTQYKGAVATTTYVPLPVPPAPTISSAAPGEG